MPRSTPRISRRSASGPAAADTTPRHPLDVLVVGGGPTGLAAAARLSKQGHQVTILDRSEALGGDLRALEEHGCRWDLAPPLLNLPAVLRDLFRKSGRPVERYVDLDVPPIARLHIFPDGSRARYVTANRAHTHDALAEDLGERAAHTWTAMVDELTDVWQALRIAIADPDPVTTWRDRALRKRLLARRSRQAFAEHHLTDPRLRRLATWRQQLQGADPADIPAWTATDLYLDRALGLWLADGGPGVLADALATRVRERRVTTHLGSNASGLVREGDQVVGVRCADGSTYRADHVVSTVRMPWTGELRRLPHVRTAAWSHLRIRRTATAPAPEILLHGDDPRGFDDVLVRTTGTAPDGQQAWSVGHRCTLAQAMLRIREAGFLTTTDLVSHQTTLPTTVPYPWTTGTSGQLGAAKVRDARPGLSVIGPSFYPGPDLHLTLWGAALTAERLGTVPRAGG